MSLRRRTVEVLIAAGLLGTAVAPPASAAGQGHAVPLRVATYNIHAGAGMDNVFDLDRQTAELRSLDAYVIGLQEVDVHWGTRSEWRDLAAELAERDFNAAPAAPELAPLWEELTDIEPGGPTYPAQDPVQRIDYVAVSKDSVRVRDAAVAETLASDHRPVVADLLLRR